MIEFIKISNKEPFQEFKDFYELAVNNNQDFIQAASISSYSKITNEVSSRYVNIKSIEKDELLFYSNYNSPKANDFNSHSQVSVNIFWNTINTQVRMKCNIRKLSRKKNIEYFKKRSKKKNAIAISSNQSANIQSYDQVIEKYEKALKNEQLDICPKYWGGYSLSPYYFEFWQGNAFRINKRIDYRLINNKWIKNNLEP